MRHQLLSRAMLRVVFFQDRRVCFSYDDYWKDRRDERTRLATRAKTTRPATAYGVLLKHGRRRPTASESHKQKFKQEDCMKYLLLIAALTAFMGTAMATSPTPDCCKGKKCSIGCCKK